MASELINRFKALEDSLHVKLAKYTTEELRTELRRRAVLKAKETREKRKENPYIYWEGEVKYVSPTYGYSIYEIDFRIESEFLNKYGYSRSFRLAGAIGFNKTNMPKVGDIVKLRYRNTKKKEYEGFKIDKSKFVEIVKRKED